MKTVIKNARVIDPQNNRDELCDVWFENKKILKVVPAENKSVEAEHVFDATGLILTAGFVDLHTHLREPGFEYKETIASGTASAVSGGFTSICCMANTQPANDSHIVTEYILQQARLANLAKVYPIGAITKNLKGETLAPFGALKASGCVAVSDDGWTVQNAQMMRMALEYAKTFGLPVSTHSIDADLAKQGCMNESHVSTRLGLKGSPAVAEDVIIARDIMLSELTGAHLHIGHLSTRGGIELVRQAKKKGLRVTCEVAPHHFTLTDEDIKDYDTHYKMCPPLRSREDILAICEAMAEGVVDAIATDHAPHALVDKCVEFDKAAFGIIGFETALPLSLRLVDKGIISLMQMVELLTISPARVFGLTAGTLDIGASADVTLFDPESLWELNAQTIFSKSHNTPFMGQKMKGRVVRTYVDGELKFKI